MTELLKSVRDDLTDRRLLPIVVLVGVGLLAAVLYFVLGSSGSSSPSATVTPGAGVRVAGIAVSQAPANANQAVAETANGTTVQHNGASHNPFALLPAQIKKPESSGGASSSVSSGGSGSSSTSSSTGSSSSSSSSTSSSTGSSSTSSTPSSPPKPAKPKTVYTVALQFGSVPQGQARAPEPASYANLSKVTPLPNAKEKVVEFVGVKTSSKGASAAFSVSGEVILHGPAVCVPSVTQCNVIELKVGKAEQLEVLNALGQPVTYELFVVSIATTKASAAAVKGVLASESRAAHSLLSSGGALTLAGLRFSAQAGVLVLAHHHAFSARAHGARHGRG
jgi:hypothetical protein